jgi:type IV pilus assembly protein PilV
MNRNKQTGYSLVEVLVSVFVVTLGMLCSSAMELVALRTTQQTGYRAIALQLAAEMADQIRATNFSQFQTSNTSNPYLTINYKVGTEPVLPAVVCFTIKSNCQAADLAKFNIYQWEQRISASLPKGRVVVCMDSEPWDRDANAYKWQCSGSESGKDQLVIKIGWNEKNLDDASKKEEESAPPIIALAVGI